MLELKNIVKDYVSGNNVTHALKRISVNFRKNEFVSILGASGCGKTTTLNIVGGLDRYTSGDLLINGKSTKDYTDRDWDTYRNHSIGFIFQTYNLIAHQNILKNVELALTISGVDKEERRARAYEALKKVGLEGMEKKKPNQLSGGQCQRVAIARALINNPEILLADEPTGALDSETSIQIMDLLKEVASDRLVIMVTHNPDLAYKYSTRIVTMSDGLLINDSNPWDGTGEEVSVEEVSKGKKKNSSMSLATSTGLSLSNLGSKLRRTILVTIAGSIGIIGVSAVLAVSRGVKDFIGSMQNDMLSAYPIEIAEQSVDYTSLVSGLSASDVKDKFEFDPENPKVGVDSMISYMMDTYADITKIKTNTIDDDLMAFLDGAPSDAVAVMSKNYGIDVTNNIFGKWYDDAMGETSAQYRNISFNGLTQRYISELKTVDGFKEYASYVDLFTNFMNELPDNKDYILEQYDVIGGDGLSTNDDDLVLVVDSNTTLTDLVLAQTGIFGHNEFLNIAQCAIHEGDEKKKEDWDEKTKEEQQKIIDDIRKDYPYKKDFDFDDLIGREFYYFPEDSIYKEYGKVADAEKTLSVSFGVMSGGELQFVFYGSYMGYPTRQAGTLNSLVGIALEKDPITGALNTEQVAAVQYPTTEETEFSEKMLYGNWIGFNQSDLIETIMSDETDMAKVLEQLSSKMKFSFLLDDKDSGHSIYTVFDDTLSPIAYYPFTPEYLMEENPIDGYSYEACVSDDWTTNTAAHNGEKLRISSILRLKEDKNFGCLDRGLYYTKDFADKYMKDASSGKVTNALKTTLTNKVTANNEFKAYVTYDYYNHGTKSMDTTGYASSLNGDLSSSFSDLFSSITGGINYKESNATHLRALSGLKTIYDEEENATFDLLPKTISIYPKSFDAKDQITEYLDTWNEEGDIAVFVNDDTKVLKFTEREKLTYTDTIQIIVTVINTLINAITVSLIVFTSLSLVVSCFMIAVITYISVVERIKEIGVIRSLGGRKGDVASLFVMENMLTGLFSGAFGIAMTYVIQIILNIVLKAKFGIVIANLTPVTALIMIGVSIVLSVVSGLIPSQSAAHKDPVVALRSGE